MSEYIGPTEWSTSENQDPASLSRFVSDTEYPGDGFGIDVTNTKGIEDDQTYRSDEGADTESS